MRQTKAVQAFPQGADAAGMVHNDRNPLFSGGIEGVVSCLM
jgi:hypothetical protein